MAHGDQMGSCSVDIVLSVARESTRELPTGFRIFNAPNPASAISKIYYELPIDGHVFLQVYDITGRQIATLVNGSRKAGYHSISFDVSALQKGVYNYRIIVQTKTTIWVQTKKIIVIK